MFRIEADDLEQRIHLDLELPPIRKTMNAQWLGDDVEDSATRIERGVGILEDHRHLASQSTKAATAGLRNVGSRECHASGRRLVQSHDDPRERRLAAARFSHQPQCLAGGNRKRDIVERVHNIAAAERVEQDRGRDAIGKLGPILAAIRDLDRELERRPAASYGRGSIHASTISGGEQLPVYPAKCVVGVERCLIPGETWRDAEAELEGMIASAMADDPEARFELTTIVGRDPVELGRDEPIVEILIAAAGDAMGADPVVRGEIGWQDSGILVDAGIPCVVFGPTGAGEHTDCEWVDLESAEIVAKALEATARSFCG